MARYKKGESGNPDQRFTSENQPENRGRKKSKLSAFIQESEIGADDINKVIKNVIFEKSQKELQQLLEDVDQPMLIRVFIRAYLEDFKRGDLTRFETLANRAIGKPKEVVEIEGSEDKPLRMVSIADMMKPEDKEE